MPHRPSYSLTELSLLALAMIVACGTVVLALAHPELWARVGREDGLVEVTTVFAFLALSAVAATRIIRSHRGARAPSFVVVLAGIFGAGEEVSWGQRILAREPPAFFATHNVQGETNIHNLLHPPWDALLGAILILGLCLSPLLIERPWVQRLEHLGLPWPRRHHAAVLAMCLAAVLLGALITQVGDLEEVGELVVVLIVSAIWSRRQDFAKDR